MYMYLHSIPYWLILQGQPFDYPGWGILTWLTYVKTFRYCNKYIRSSLNVANYKIINSINKLYCIIQYQQVLHQSAHQNMSKWGKLYINWDLLFHIVANVKCEHILHISTSNWISRQYKMQVNTNVKHPNVLFSWLCKNRAKLHVILIL